MLSDTDDVDCDFETDETTVDDSAADDSWLQNVEARFESVVTPILARYEAPVGA